MFTCVLYLVLPMSTSGGRYHSVTTSCVYFLTGTPAREMKTSSPGAPCERELQRTDAASQTEIGELQFAILKKR